MVKYTAGVYIYTVEPPFSGHSLIYRGILCFKGHLRRPLLQYPIFTVLLQLLYKGHLSVMDKRSGPKVFLNGGSTV